MDISDRMQVNAAIECLIAGKDESGEAAKVVIEFGHTLPEASSIQIGSSIHKKSGGGHITGYSPGQGDMTIKEPEREEHKEWSYGVSGKSA